MVNKIIKSGLHYGSMIVVGIILIVGFYYLIEYGLSNSFDFNCLNNTATNYCNSINKIGYDYSNKQFTIGLFYCQEKTYDPRIQDFPGIQSYKFLSEEIDKCTTRRSWLRQYMEK